MTRFFSPTKQKLLYALGIMLASISVFFLRLIPVQADILDLRKLPRLVAIVLVRWPIQFFDLLTDRRFAPRSEAFIVFPTMTQLGFALLCDLVLFYLLACLIVRLKSKRS